MSIEDRLQELELDMSLVMSVLADINEKLKRKMKKIYWVKNIETGKTFEVVNGVVSIIPILPTGVKFDRRTSLLEIYK